MWKMLWTRWHPHYWAILAVAIIGLAAVTAGSVLTYRTYQEQSAYRYVPTDENWKQYIQSLVDIARQNIDKTMPAASSSAVVEVAGAVTHPGVYKLSHPARRQDAILAAGGFSRYANQKYIHQDINLAAAVKDGEKIYIPLENETITLSNNPDGTREDKSNASDNEWLQFFNSATKTELMELSGIGETRAKAIMEQRPFTQLNEIASKTNIPISTLETIWKGNSNNNE